MCLPTLTPREGLTVLGQPLKVSVRHRFRFELVVDGPLVVGRTTYRVQHLRVLDDLLGERFEARVTLTQLHRPVSATGTFQGHLRTVRSGMHDGIDALTGAPRWAAAIRALLAYQEVIGNARSVGGWLHQVHRTQVWARAGLVGDPSPDPAELVRAVAAGCAFPGHALPFALELLDRDPGLSADDVTGAVRAVYPGLLDRCPHLACVDATVAAAAVAGCAGRVGGCLVVSELRSIASPLEERRYLGRADSRASPLPPDAGDATMTV